MFEAISSMVILEIIKKDEKNPLDKIILSERRTDNYIKQGCFPSPIIAFVNMGQAFANALGEDKIRRRRKCLIQWSINL